MYENNVDRNSIFFFFFFYSDLFFKNRLKGTVYSFRGDICQNGISYLLKKDLFYSKKKAFGPKAEQVKMLYNVSSQYLRTHPGSKIRVFTVPIRNHGYHIYRKYLDRRD